jgi:hypothetical protein
VEFQVSIACEHDRQEAAKKEAADEAAREKERFEKRENNYKPRSSCKPPDTIEENAGWEDRSLDHWKRHPEEPTAWCVSGNGERKPLRQRSWSPPNECEALASFRPVEIKVNGRGLRGCELD